MNKAIKLQLVKGRKKTYDEAGTLQNENQTATFDQTTIENLISNIKESGWSHFKVLSVYRIEKYTAKIEGKDIHKERFVEDKKEAIAYQKRIDEALKSISAKEPKDDYKQAYEEQAKVNEKQAMENKELSSRLENMEKLMEQMVANQNAQPPGPLKITPVVPTVEGEIIEKPKPTDAKPLWVDYIQKRGYDIDPEQTKPILMELVEAIESTNQ